MQKRSSRLCGAALGVLLAAGLGASAQAKARHHHVAAAEASDAEAKIDSLTAAVSALEQRLNDETAARQATEARAAAAEAKADAAEADAQAARSELQSQIQTIPGEVQNDVQSDIPKLPNNVSIKLGGFAALESVYRSKNDVADIGSNYSKIPYDNNPLAHLSEFRGTARQSRLSLLVQGDLNADTHAAFYSEFDFLADAQTGNSNESNSYSPRIRNVYGTVDWDSLGLHLLAGQNWSLATMNGKGITARSEVIPPTIEAQYVPGFVWARQPQIRLVKDFDNKQLWVAVSLENPQTTFASAATGLATSASGVTPNTGAVGISLLNNVNTFSYDHVPDVIGKVAFEPIIGGAQPLHLEVFGIWRDYYDRVTFTAGNALGVPVGGCMTGSAGTTPAACKSDDTSGGGVGAGFTWNAAPKMLDLQGSFLTGNGVGRYGSGQLPDVITAPNGSPQPIPETMFLLGGTLHATPDLDLYLMYGQERQDKEAVTNLVGAQHAFFGYGNPNAALAGCLIEGGVCTVDTQQIDQITAGLWDKVYNGKFGSLRIGLQYSHTNLTAFPGLNSLTAGVGSAVTPKTSDDMVFTSFRFYPAF